MRTIYLHRHPTASRRASAPMCFAEPNSPSSRRELLGALSTLLATAPAASQAASAPFLQSTGARGFIADEEAYLVSLREEAELKVREDFERERQLIMEDIRKNQTGLCATPFGVDIVGITEVLFLLGALAGGLAARNRKAEAEKLNEQLRKINLQLRQQARAGTMYAPGLTYAPATQSAAPYSKPTRGNGAAQETEQESGNVALQTRPSPLSTVDEELTPEQLKCRETMREGKRLLRSNQGAAALVRFEKASLMSRKLEDKLLERRACRGMAASARMQGNLTAAIKHLEKVLELSKAMEEFTGDADAYGSMADIYTDLGEFEKAATYYDKYIQRMQDDSGVV